MSSRPVHWGQLVIGPPGSGKSTYCAAMYQLLNAMGRKTIIVNLDPANESESPGIKVDLADLISVDDVMEAYNLGPNGGLMYCLEYLEKNMDWLENQLDQFTGYYFLFDCPGQAELYTHHASFYAIAQRLLRLNYRVAAVHLVDAQHCTDAGKYIAAALMALQTMVRLEVPHVNALSKADLLEGAAAGELPFDLEFYTDPTEARLLIDHVHGVDRRDSDAAEKDEDGSADAGDDTIARTNHDRKAAAHAPTGRFGVIGRRFRVFHEAMVELINDYSLCTFVPISVRDAASLTKALALIDKANGFVRTV